MVVVDIPLWGLLSLIFSIASFIGILVFLIMFLFFKSKIKNIFTLLLGKMMSTDEIEEMVDRKFAEKEGPRAFQNHMEKHYGKKGD